MYSVTPVRVHSLIFVESSATLDQFALRVPRSASLHIRHASLDRLAFCLTRGPGDMSAPAFLTGLYKLQPALPPARHQETLLDPHASVSLAFGLEKRCSDSLFIAFYNCCRIHIIRTCYALLTTVSVEFV